MAKALYRKYRPCSMSEVVGQEQITVPLSSALKSGKFSHAYLFTGPRGCGKTSVARIFAHAVNNFPYEIEDEYVDIIEIDAASNTGVDNIRELREKACVVPSQGKYKIYIIDEVHMLSNSAFNALLKTLEEPPEHVIFIMATTNPEKVPITILSRAQVYQFRLVEPETMVAHLRKIADTEQIPIDDSALAIIARRGGGSFRDSLSLLDQISSLADGQIDASTIEKAFGLPSAQVVDALLDTYRASDLPGASALLRDYYATGGSAEVLAAELITRILDQPDSVFYGLLSALPGVRDPFASAKLLLCFMPAGAPAAPVRVPPARTATARPSAPSTPPSVQAPAPNTTPTPAPDAAPTAPPATSAQPATPADFSWENFLEQVDLDSAKLRILLTQSSYRIEGDTLVIYPGNRVAKKNFAKPESQQIFIRHAGGLALKISDQAAVAAPASPTISKISDIMGNIQELKKDDGTIPF